MAWFRDYDTPVEAVPPSEPGPAAVSRWLGFHAYVMAIGSLIQHRSIDEIAAQMLTTERWAPGPVCWEEVTVTHDAQARTVTLQTRDGLSRTATVDSGESCVVLPDEGGSIELPTRDSVTLPAATRPPSAESAPWPVGEAIDRTALSADVNLDAIEGALDSAVADGRTRACVVAIDGRLIAERHVPPFTRTSRHLSWSMTKSLVGVLIGRLVHESVLELEQPAPIPEWQRPGDRRAEITLDDLLRMSSGLDCPVGPSPWSHQDRHFRVYTGLADVREHVVGLPLRAAPGSRWAYQNSDPLIAAEIAACAAARLSIPRAAMPWTLLFDELGMSSVALGADARGNYVLSGWSAATAADWARLGQLYLDDGEWLGKRLLPEGWLQYASTPAPAAQPGLYGGAFMWLGEAEGALPPGTIAAAGAFGQRTIVVPSARLVVVRLGHSDEDRQFIDGTVRLARQLVVAAGAQP
jgi:CubicO group peptidase (beta-lactamase class C family)